MAQQPLWNVVPTVLWILFLAVLVGMFRSEIRDLLRAVLARLRSGGTVKIGAVEIGAFRFAQTQSGADPTWGFSDRQGIRVAGSALKRVVVSLLPKELGDEAKRAAHFAVSDVSRA